MGDQQNKPVLATLLDVIVASALIGTFIVFGYPGSNAGPSAEPSAVARLAEPR